MYVDDPILIVRGTKNFLGISLSLRKGQVGANVDWIGYSLAIRADMVVATILMSRLEDVRQLIDRALGSNMVPIKELRTLVGKVQSLASLLYIWRPFVHMFYASMHSSPSGAAPNCVWTKQIILPLTWVKAFLDQQTGNLERKFSLESHLRRGRQIRITTDTSPWGLGAVLEFEGEIKAWLADSITSDDRRVLSLGPEPSSKDQQSAEALAILVALRQWAPLWRDQRVRLAHYVN